MKLIGIGDAVVDYYKDQDVFYPGGSVVNVAVFAKQNGAEEAAYLGIVGLDKEGDHLLDSLKKENVDTSRVRRVLGPTGEAVVTLNEEGDRVFIGTNKDVRVQSLVSIQINELDLAYIQQFDIVHATISLNSGIEEQLGKLAGKEISFDFSSSEYWDMDYVKKVAPYLNYAFFSGSDLTESEITDLIQSVHDLGVEVVGVTRGAEPAIFSKNGQYYLQRPIETDVLDTMGAGDSFIGAFLCHYFEKRNMEAALEQAAKFASKVCQYYGAFGHGRIKDLLSNV
ncbi:PfkB family carbohydrate kinase [Neobacillus niacini]|uniref:PfkB family carbohydrate kinase n=1 Tax=Neobacillus niacini TaxID=86668 RepID=UPI00398382CB